MYVLHLVQISIWTILLFKFSLCIFILHPENVNFVLEKYSPPQKKGKSKPKHCSVHKKHLKVFRHCCCSANTRQLAIPAFQPQVWSPSWKPEPFDRASGRLTAALLRELETKANKLLAHRDLKSGLRRQRRHHVEFDGTAVRFTSPLPGGDSKAKWIHRRKLQARLLNVPRKCARNLETIQRRFREDQLLHQKK